MSDITIWQPISLWSREWTKYSATPSSWRYVDLQYVWYDLWVGLFIRPPKGLRSSVGSDFGHYVLCSRFVCFFGIVIEWGYQRRATPDEELMFFGHEL